MTLLERRTRTTDSSPTGSGNRLWRAEVEGDLRRAARPPRTADRLRLPRPALPARGVPVRLQHRPRQRRDGLRRTPVHRRLVTRLVARGIAVAPITLHTGVSSQEAGEGPQPEWYHVPAATARLVELTRAPRRPRRGDRHHRHPRARVGRRRRRRRESWGWTDRVVTPAHPPVVVNGLITGWHDAQASHLLLVEAIAGTELAQAAYDAAARRAATTGTSSATRACSSPDAPGGSRKWSGAAPAHTIVGLQRRDQALGRSDPTNVAIAGSGLSRSGNGPASRHGWARPAHRADVAPWPHAGWSARARLKMPSLTTTMSRQSSSSNSSRRSRSSEYWRGSSACCRPLYSTASFANG